jgi:uncharacterized protein (DUF2249 family)
MPTNTTLDVRSLPPAERHPRIFKLWESLPEGETLTLLVDHDPKPLQHTFRAEEPGRFAWRVLEAGPTLWKIEIQRLMKTDKLSPEETVRDILARYPESKEVLFRHGVDQCCGGVHPLRMAAEAHGVSLPLLMEELNRVVYKNRPVWTSTPAQRSLDVREILRQGGEPFAGIMTVAHATAPGESFELRVLFEPKPLFGVLGGQGFEHWSERLADDDWRVIFHRPALPSAQ